MTQLCKVYSVKADSPHSTRPSLMHARALIHIRIHFKQGHVLPDSFALACDFHIIGCIWIAACC